MASQEVVVWICFIGVAKCAERQTKSVPKPDQAVVRYRCRIILDVEKDPTYFDNEKIKRTEVYAGTEKEGRYHAQWHGAEAMVRWVVFVK